MARQWSGGRVATGPNEPATTGFRAATRMQGAPAAYGRAADGPPGTLAPGRRVDIGPTELRDPGTDHQSPEVFS